MANDPVLQRPLFQGMAPSTPTVTGGITSVPTPEENARELRNMFAPVQPVQAFQDGGIVDAMGGAFYPGAAVENLPPAPAGTGEGFFQQLTRPFRALVGPVFTPQPGAAATPPAPPPPAVPALPAPVEVGGTPGSRLPVEPPAPVGIAAAAPVSQRQKGELELTLEGIRAERARSAEDKRQNALLALMQAGLAMAGGTSPNAVANIAAGGQSGIASFANMERARREEQAALRREETSLLLAREQMRAQEERAPDAVRTAAFFGGWNPSMGPQGLEQAAVRGMQVMREMEKDPEMVRTYAILGGFDPKKGGRENYMEAVQRGYQLTLSKDAPARAEALLKLSATDPTLLTEEQKKRLTGIVVGSVSGLGGAGQAPPPNATVIPWTQLPVR